MRKKGARKGLRSVPGPGNDSCFVLSSHYRISISKGSFVLVGCRPSSLQNILLSVRSEAHRAAGVSDMAQYGWR